MKAIRGKRTKQAVAASQPRNVAQQLERAERCQLLDELLASKDPWGLAGSWRLERQSSMPGGGACVLEPGVNFFVFVLESFGAETGFSCTGHPTGFYVTFCAPYELALLLHGCGFFSVEVEGKGYWSLRQNYPQGSQVEHERSLRWAAEAWQKRLLPTLLLALAEDLPEAAAGA